MFRRLWRLYRKSPRLRDLTLTDVEEIRSSELDNIDKLTVFWIVVRLYGTTEIGRLAHDYFNDEAECISKAGVRHATMAAMVGSRKLHALFASLTRGIIQDGKR